MVKVLGLVAILLIVLAGNVLSYDRQGTRKNLVIHPTNEDDPTFPDQVIFTLKSIFFVIYYAYWILYHLCKILVSRILTRQVSRFCLSVLICVSFQT